MRRTISGRSARLTIWYDQGRCFHNRVIVSGEALFVVAEQISSFVSPSALSGVRA
jgi:hypothetical protein